MWFFFKEIPSEAAKRFVEKFAEFRPLSDEGELLEGEAHKLIDTVHHRAFHPVEQSADAASDVSISMSFTAGEYCAPEYPTERLRKTMLGRWPRTLYQRSPHFADLGAAEPLLPK
jgi:hypothetical protein